MSENRSGFGMRPRGALLAGIIAAAALTGPSTARAGIVGTISVTPPTVTKTADVGGERTFASENVNLAGTCLAGATVHWIQLLTLSTPFGPGGLGFAGFSPNKTFIDPISGQPIGPGQTGNATPYYDITANTQADLFKPDNWLRDGTGTNFGDTPQVPWASLNAKNTPFTFTAQTLLVATTKAAPNTLNVLGGFQWGFTLNIGPNAVTLQKTTGLAWADINAGTWQSALDQDFGPKGTYTFQQATCPKGNPTVSFTLVPEPSSVVMAALGIPGTIVIMRRQRRRQAA